MRRCPPTGQTACSTPAAVHTHRALVPALEPHLRPEGHFEDSRLVAAGRGAFVEGACRVTLERRRLWGGRRRAAGATAGFRAAVAARWGAQERPEPLEPRGGRKGRCPPTGQTAPAASCGAVLDGFAVDGGPVRPARHAEVNGRRRGGAHRHGRRVAEGVGRIDVDSAAAGKRRRGGRVHGDDRAAVGRGVDQGVGELGPALVKVGGAAAVVGFEAVGFGEVAWGGRPRVAASGGARAGARGKAEVSSRWWG